jgi:hypothetical protein
MAKKIINKVVQRYYSPTPAKLRKIATCVKIFLTGLTGIITHDFHQTTLVCLIGCLVCDFIVNLYSPDPKK